MKNKKSGFVKRLGIYLLALSIPFFLVVAMVQSQQYMNIEKEVAELQKQLAKPFKFHKSIVIYSLLLVLAACTPFIGSYLYLQADWWMFFCILISGIIELLCIMPLGLINESISTDWKYDPDSVDKTTKQIKSILWTSI